MASILEEVRILSDQVSSSLSQIHVILQLQLSLCISPLYVPQWIRLCVFSGSEGGDTAWSECQQLQGHIGGAILWSAAAAAESRIQHCVPNTEGRPALC